MSEDRRLGKLHKQTEVEDNDDADDTSIVSGSSSTVTTRGVVAPTMQTASNCSSFYLSTSQSRETQAPPCTRNKTLIRGHALEETSPPPESFINQISHNGEMQNGSFSTNGTAGCSMDRIGKLKGQNQEAKEFLLASHKFSSDSGNGTLDHTDDISDTSVLSQDSSLDNTSVKDAYRDSSGVNIPKFIRETLHKSAKDRKTILFLEEQLLSFINNNNVLVHTMAEMTSYDRMIVHRLAAYLGLEHNVDGTGKCVVLNRTENTRSVKLSDVILCEDCHQREPKKKILLKKPASFDEKHGRGSNKALFGSNRARSLEERQQKYIEARERIFKDDEDSCEGTPESSILLTVNFHPHQPSQDSRKQNEQSTTQWQSTESNVAVKDSSNINYNPAPNHLTNSQALVPAATSNDLPRATSSATESGLSPIRQFHPHVSSDGSLYNFDPSCPPPFMIQTLAGPPPATPPTYHNDSVPDITSRFAAVYLGPFDQGNDACTVGVPTHQPVPMMSTFALHPQSTSTSAYLSQMMQGQYFVTPPSSDQQPVRYVAIPYHQGQQFLQGAMVDGQGHTTVPMPTVGVPSVQGAGGFQMVSSPYQQPVAVGQPPHCVDLNSFTYNYRAVPETLVVGGSGDLTTSSTVGGTPGPQHLVLAYAQPTQQQHHHPLLPSHQTQFTTAGNGTYYTIPVSSTTPPLSLTQPPPSSQQQQQSQHQPTVFYASNLGNPLTYQIPVSIPSASTSTTSFKPASTPFLQTQYTSQPPHHPHHPHPVVISPSNNQHPAHFTLNYAQPFNPAQPVPFNPAQPVPFNPAHSVPYSPQPVSGQLAASHGPQLVAVQTNPYQVKPLGATFLQFSRSPVLQTPQLSTHLQPYQILRPAGSVSDVRLGNHPVSVRSKLSPLQITTDHSQLHKPKSSNQYHHSKKWVKRPAQNVEDYHGFQGVASRQQTTGHLNIMAPYGVQGPVPHTFSHAPSSFSHRQ